MRILFDSHALVWFALGDRRFPAELRRKLEEPGTEFIVSAVCIWEITAKFHRGKWSEAAAFVADLDITLRGSPYVPLPVTIEHARVAGSLAWDHRDPFDRMLAAQSQIECAPLVTADRAFRLFGTAVIW